jgi:hypothetical protein
MVRILTAEIFGLPIPDAGPVFAIALAVHIACGLTAVIAGALAATAKKRRGRHPRAGRIYVWTLGGSFTTATIMAAIRWREDAHLFAIAVAAFGLGLYGYSATNSSTNGSPACQPSRPNLRRRGSSPFASRQGSSTISSRLNVPVTAVRRLLLAHVKEWNSDPRRAAIMPLQGVNEVKTRLIGAPQIGPEQRWAALAGQLDQRLLRQGDWPALAQLMQRVDDQGHDVAALARGLVTL